MATRLTLDQKSLGSTPSRAVYGAIEQRLVRGALNPQTGVQLSLALLTFIYSFPLFFEIVTFPYLFVIYIDQGFYIIIFMRIQKVFIASDHAGVCLKKTAVEWLKTANFQYEDLGPYTEDVSVDYPDFAEKVGNAIQKQRDTYGILICGSGIGISMAANKMHSIRAALCSEPLSAKLSRLHNDANVLCMAGRLIGPTMAENILSVFFTTDFEGGRHEKRIQKIHLLEGKTV